MNDRKQSRQDTIRFDLVTLLLDGIENRKTIIDTLNQASVICQQDNPGKIVLKAEAMVTELRGKYDQGGMTDHEAKEEISDILILLT
ncbi:MAG: hypothetical protein AAB553_07630 [Patescibacteria group bacterium]